MVIRTIGTCPTGGTAEGDFRPTTRTICAYRVLSTLTGIDRVAVCRATLFFVERLYQPVSLTPANVTDAAILDPRGAGPIH